MWSRGRYIAEPECPRPRCRHTTDASVSSQPITQIVPTTELLPDVVSTRPSESTETVPPVEEIRSFFKYDRFYEQRHCWLQRKTYDSMCVSFPFLEESQSLNEKGRKQMFMILTCNILHGTTLNSCIISPLTCSSVIIRINLTVFRICFKPSTMNTKDRFVILLWWRENDGVTGLTDIQMTADDRSIQIVPLVGTNCGESSSQSIFYDHTSIRIDVESVMCWKGRQNLMNCQYWNICSIVPISFF